MCLGLSMASMRGGREGLLRAKQPLGLRIDAGKEIIQRQVESRSTDIE